MLLWQGSIVEIDYGLFRVFGPYFIGKLLGTFKIVIFGLWSFIRHPYFRHYITMSRVVCWLFAWSFLLMVGRLVEGLSSEPHFVSSNRTACTQTFYFRFKDVSACSTASISELYAPKPLELAELNIYQTLSYGHRENRNWKKS